MKVVTVAGTRPELIRLSRLIPLLDEQADHVFVHTGQNADPELRDVFFSELGIRKPDVDLAPADGSFAHRVGSLLGPIDDLFVEHRPERVVILGDTDSGLAAFVAARRGIPVCHLEAGNRAYDDAVPEEINRRLIDHASSLLLPYTGRSAQHLLREGISRDRIVVVGNPISEVLDFHAAEIEASDVRTRVGVADGGYLLLTLHRAETADLPQHRREVLTAVGDLARELDLRVVFPIHPRTASHLAAAGDELDPEIFVTSPPLGFFDFVSLEKHARLVLTDSGTVLEECALLGVRSVILRDVTERPELLECGSTILAGRTRDRIHAASSLALTLPADWEPPLDYLRPAVAEGVSRIVLGALPFG